MESMDFPNFIEFLHVEDTQRYHRLSPSAIGISVSQRAQLVKQNLVSEELLK